MWFFMITCYVMSLITTMLLGIGFIQSFLKFPVLQANHVSFMILCSIVYFFTETLVIFFFVGTGVSIKEYTRDHQMSPSFHQRSIQIKRKVYPPLLLNMLFMIILFVLVGAVDTYRFPVWGYQAFFLGCILHYIYIKTIQNDSFRDNTKVILEMSGVPYKFS